MEVVPFTRDHLEGALTLFESEGWDTYTTDPEQTYRALVAPGSTTLVAVDGTVVLALVQLQSDGEIQAHLSALVVAKPARRHGIARTLLAEGLRRAGGMRIDILTLAEDFYRRIGASSRPGFRLTREDLGLAAHASGARSHR